MHRQISLIGLLVRDIDRTVEFYERVFGFQVIQEKSTNPKGDSRAFIKSGDIVIELTQLKGGTASDPQGVIDHIGFIVEDIEKEIERLKELGVETNSLIEGHIPVNRILNVRNGKIFYFRGINGESIGLIELNKDSNFRK
ncbi:MAG: VOC family protein [Chloroflexi bacterium]|nr:VOC family protein [Chloroflexota bacterium]